MVDHDGAVTILANDDCTEYNLPNFHLSSLSMERKHEKDFSIVTTSIYSPSELAGDDALSPSSKSFSSIDHHEDSDPDLRSCTSRERQDSSRPTTDEADSSAGDGKEEITFDSSWPKSKDMIITAPYDYLLSNPGKDIRKQVLSAFNVWLQADDESCEIINRAISMLHNASLLIDDIQDNSKLRRGSPVAHSVFGVAQTINTANYVYFLAQNELLRLKQWPAALQMFNEELLNLHRGQGMELYWRDTLTLPSEKDYLQMISNKTGGLFRLALRLMQAVSPTENDVLPLADVIGLIFQIQDDYKNLSSEQMAATKGYCEDLSEGKFSFPIIHAIRNSESGNCEVLNILKLRTEDDTLKAHAVDYMRDVTDSFSYTKDVLRRLHGQAMGMMAAMGERNPALEAILNRLVAD
ncbi:hypothetical protein MMC24_006753 [Lignoscripta atroalba]|nr:hypothetical protein [Lignoscripta atroalba]